MYIYARCRRGRKKPSAYHMYGKSKHHRHIHGSYISPTSHSYSAWNWSASKCLPHRNASRTSRRNGRPQSTLSWCHIGLRWCSGLHNFKPGHRLNRSSGRGLSLVWNGLCLRAHLSQCRPSQSPGKSSNWVSKNPAHSISKPSHMYLWRQATYKHGYSPLTGSNNRQCDNCFRGPFFGGRTAWYHCPNGRPNHFSN